jgi:competence protein ComEC
MGTGPMVAYHFGQLSLAGFLSNPIMVPIVGLLVVPLGLMIALLSLLLPGAALPFLWLAESLVSLVLWMVRFFSAFPFASVAIPPPNFFEAGIGYLVILTVFVVRRKVLLYCALGVAAVGLIGSSIYWWHERWRRTDLRITHLAVGHGDAAVVELPGSKVLLIDAGGAASGGFDTGESIVAPFLRSRRIRKVDYLLVTHPRVDHYGGMKTIVEKFAPSEFWSGPNEGRTRRYQELEAALKVSGTKQVFLSSRDPCRTFEQVTLCVLYPPEGKTADTSLVIRLSFGQVHFLFTGDIEAEDEMALLQNRTDLPSTVLKVPRHGSRTSSSEDFIAMVKPKLAIVSVGRRNSYGLPQEEVLARYAAAGAQMLRTDQDGAIIIETDGGQLRYRGYQSGKKGALVY